MIADYASPILDPVIRGMEASNDTAVAGIETKRAQKQQENQSILPQGLGDAINKFSSPILDPIIQHMQEDNNAKYGAPLERTPAATPKVAPQQGRSISEQIGLSSPRKLQSEDQSLDVSLPTEKTHRFNLNEYMQSTMNGVLKGVSADGFPEYSTSQGTIRVNPSELVKGFGLDPEAVDLSVNTSKTPVANIPAPSISTFERVKLSPAVSNTAGRVSFLTQKYGNGNFQIDPENGITVKENGVWYQVDPDFFQGADPYKIAEHLISGARSFGKTFSAIGRGLPVVKYLAPKDSLEDTLKKSASSLKDSAVSLKDAAAEGVGVVKGGLSSTLQGNFQDLPGDIAESIPGAVKATMQAVGQYFAGNTGLAATTAISDYANTTFGKISGTYKADPAERAAEIGLDVGFTLAGQKIAEGVKPTIDEVFGVFKKLGRGLNEGSKETAKNMITTLSAGGQREVVDHVFDDGLAANRVSTLIKKTAATSKNSTEVTAKLATEQLGTLKSMAEKVDGELPRQWKKEIQPVLKDAAEMGNFKANFKDGVDNLAKWLEDKGYGYVEYLKRDNLPDLPKFTAYTSSQQTGPLAQAGKDATKFSAKSAQALQTFVNDVLENRDLGALKGAMGAKKLLDLHSSINSAFNDIFTDSEDNVVRNAATAFTNEVKDNFIKKEIGKSQNLLDAFTKATNNYEEYRLSVKKFTKGLDNPEQLQAFMKQVYNKNVANLPAQREVFDNVVALLGNEGLDYKKKLADLNAARTFAPTVGKLGIRQILGGFGTGAAAGYWTGSPIVGGILGVGTAVGGVIQSKPRIGLLEAQAAAKLAPAANMASTLFKAMGPAEINWILKNPPAFNAIMRQFLDVPNMKDQADSLANQYIQGKLQR